MSLFRYIVDVLWWRKGWSALGEILKISGNWAQSAGMGEKNGEYYRLVQ